MKCTNISFVDSMKGALLEIQLNWNNFLLSPKAKMPKDDGELVRRSSRPHKPKIIKSMAAELISTTTKELNYSPGHVYGPAHLKTLKRIMAYLKATKHFGLCFDGNCLEGLKAFFDADFASDIDTRRSITEYVCMFGGTPVFYCNLRQQLVTTSTTGAEYVAECECVKEVVWLRNVLSHIGEEQNGLTTLYCGNQSAIRLVKNPEFHHRAKHIDVKFHFVREKQEEKVIDAVYVHKDSQLADIFTKSMGNRDLSD